MEQAIASVFDAYHYEHDRLKFEQVFQAAVATVLDAGLRETREEAEQFIYWQVASNQSSGFSLNSTGANSSDGAAQLLLYRFEPPIRKNLPSYSLPKSPCQATARGPPQLRRMG